MILSPVHEASRDPIERADRPAVRLADHAIGLWQAAAELGDPSLLESLRPLLMQVGRTLAREILDRDADGTPQ